MSEPTAKKSGIQSIERAAAILKCFDGREELGITEISKLVGLHKSTAAGLVNTLKNEKFLEQNAQNGKFTLGIELFRLCRNVKSGLKNICLPYLEELLADTKETVNFVVRDDDSVVYIEKKESPYSMRICTSVGQRLPLYCTAVGKAILAFLPSKEIEGILEKTKFVKYTEKTITDKAVLTGQLAEIRQQGYAWEEEEFEDGLVCVAVPILNSAGISIAGISVSGPFTRMTPEIRLNFAQKLIKAAKKINRVVY